MVTTIVSPFSPNRLDKGDYNSPFQFEIALDDRARLACMEKSIRTAMAFRPWGQEFDSQQVQCLNWWLSLCKQGFPTHQVEGIFSYLSYTHQCSFRCIDWVRGFGFCCGYEDAHDSYADEDTMPSRSNPLLARDGYYDVDFLDVVQDSIEPADFDPAELTPHKLEHPRFGKSGKQRLCHNSLNERAYIHSLNDSARWMADHDIEQVDGRKASKGHRQGRHTTHPDWWEETRSSKWDTNRDRKQRTRDRAHRWQARMKRDADWMLFTHYFGSRGTAKWGRFVRSLDDTPVIDDEGYYAYKDTYDQDDEYLDPYFWESDDPYYWHPSEYWWGFGTVTEKDFPDYDPEMRSGWSTTQDPYAPEPSSDTEDDISDVTWLTPHKYMHPRFGVFSKCQLRDKRRDREESYNKSQRDKRRARILAGIADRQRYAA